MAEVLHGNRSGNQINVSKDKTQAYGLSGNDTLISNGKNDVLLIGGSGKDRLIMMGGVGTLSGGTGKDTFELTYSADNPITAVIEDFEPSKDKISVNFVGKTAPRLSSVKSGDDVVWKDKDGLFNLTLKSVRDNDYFDGKANPKVWDVLKITNDERETQGLSPLTLSEGLMLGASIRAEEITALGESGALPEYKHTRPSGLSYATVFEEIGKSYHNHGENLDAGADSPVDVMQDWMNSPAHRKNILDGKFLKLGVGYDYREEDPTENQHYWVQLFADSLNNPETVSMADISVAQVNAVSKSVTLTGKTYDNTVYGATIQARDRKDTISNSGLAVSIAGGAGDDLILNSGSFSTICAGAGNDRISLASNSKENLIEYAAGDGSDTITGFHANDTLRISGGEYTFAKVGKDVVVTVGADSITLSDAASLKNINFDGTWSKIAILTDNKDAYSNTVSGATIRARAGDDFISNYAASSFIDGEKGNDFIQNSKAANVLISGGFGEDSVVNSGSSAIIIADADNDSIQNSGSYVTIEGGFGNDKITLTGRAKNNLIQYKLGDGNDIIYGFNDDDTLNISDADYATAKSGKNIVVAVGNDSITLVNAKNLKTVNIEGKQNKQVILTESSDAYNNSVESATIRARGGNDSIKNSGENVSICAGNGNDQITLTSNAKNNVVQYNLGDGNDTVDGFRADSTLQLGDGNDTYFTFKNGNDIVVRVGKNSITLADAATLPNVHIAGTKSEPADLDKLITLTEDDDNYSNTISGATIEALGGDDKITLASGSQNLIQYTGGFDTISGFDKNDTLQLGDGSDTYSTLAVSNDIVAKVGTSYLWLLNAASLSGINIIGTEQELDDADKITTLTANNDTHNGNESAAMIFALGGNDTISNTGANTTIDAGADNDLIENYGHHALIIGGSGNDTLLNLISKGEDTVDNKLITGTNDADNISNTVEGATINALGGDDTIENYGASSIINGGNGNDLISLSSNATDNLIEYGSGDGNDTVYGFNETSTLSIGGGSYTSVISDDDIIVTVGDDSILLVDAATLKELNIDGTEDTTPAEDSKLITLTDGDDTYANTVEGVTINALGGDDTVINVNDPSYSSENGYNVAINMGAGDDSVYNYEGDYVTINTGAGNDTVHNRSWYTTINTGAGDDSIYNDYDSNKGVSICAGSGNDTIRNDGDNVLFVYASGDGNDLIEGFNETSTLSIGGGSFSTATSGKDIILKVDDASITLVNAAGLSSINIDGTEDTSSSDTIGVTIDNTVSNTLITGTAYDDSIVNSGASVTIQARAGDDDIFSEGNNVIIDGGMDNDSIWNSGGQNVSINGGFGSDTIGSNAENVTINGGSDDDLISLMSGSQNLIQYSAGDGADTIYGFDYNDTLSIGGGSYTSVISDDDIILTVGDDSILLKDAASLSSINIDGTEDTTPAEDSKLITLTEGNDTYDNTVEGATILALAGDDTIENYGASVSIDGGAGNDSINHIAGQYVTINSGAGDDFIDNSGSSQYNDYITINSGTGDDSISNGGHDVTINAGDGNDTVENHRDWVVINGGAGADYITTKTGIMAEGHVTINGGSNNDTIINSNPYSDNSISGGAGSDSIINAGASSTISGGAGNDIISLASSATNNVIQYTSGDSNDTIYGFDYNDTLQIGGGSYSSVISDDDIILTVGDDSILLVNAASLANSLNIDGTEDTAPAEDSKLITLTDGNDTYDNTVEGATILAIGGNDTINNNYASVSIDGGNDNDYITNTGVSSTIIGGTGNDYIYNAGADFVSIISDEGSDTIYNNSNSVTIDGGAGADSIRNYYGNSGKNVSISGGADNDTIHLGSYDSYVTVSGGTGDDRISLGSNGSGNVVVYNEGDGNDSVEGFNATSTLQIGGGNGTYSTQISGSNIIVTVGDGSILLINRASLANSLNIDGVENPIGVTINNTLSNTLITGTAYNDSIRNYIKNVTVDGDKGNDTIINGDTFRGDSIGDNVSIIGGEGDDYLWNKNGSDVTISGNNGDDYFRNWSDNVTMLGESGNDTIRNFSDNSMLIGGSGNDSIWNNYEIYINGTPAADNLGKNATIDGGAGNDTISNYGYSAIISGGTGDDTIGNNWNFEKNGSFYEDDSIGNNILFQYASGDGNDIIYGFNETSTLSIVGSYSSVTNDNNDVILTVGNDSISLIGAATLSTVNIVSSTSTISFNNVLETDAVVEDDNDENKIVSYNSEDDADTVTEDGTNYSSLIGGDGADYIVNQGHHVLIDGGAGDDSIQNESTAAYSTIAGGAGRDSIENYGASSIIDGGNGNDSVTNAAAQVALDGGSGNDSIINSAAQVSINGGKGSDTISLTSDAALNLIQYTSGDGDDIIYGFNSNTTLQISGKGYSSMTSGNDIVLTVDDGKITLAGAATLSTVNIDLVIPSIPADALHYNGHYYHLFNKGFTWEDAQAYCESRGGYLLTVTDKDEQDAVQSLLDENGSRNGYWLGGYKNADGWQWVTDEEFSYTNWSDDQPDGSGNYLHMYAMKDDGAYKGKWDDTSNDLSNAGYTKTKQGLICEWGEDNESDSEIIRLTENADFYHNLADGATILALGDNDTIGNDGDNVSISGGAGKDSVRNRGSNVTLDGGKGNDRITLASDAENNVIQYTFGDGNDTIWGFKADSTLNLLIDKKSNYSSVTSGNDIKINIVGGGSITLKDAKNKTPHIIIGASGSSGGSSGGSGNGGTSGNGGSGGSTGGTSGSGGNSGASGGNSASGSSGSNSSSNGSSGNGNRNYSVSRTTSVRQNVVTVPSGNQFFANYQSGQKLYLGSEYTGAFFDNAGDFVAGSATGAICVRNALEKVIDFSDGAGNLIKAYAARNAGLIDGRNIAGREIINGSKGSDTIYAGDGGSQLWGGEGFVQDILVGGGGSDTFLSGKGHGADLIRNASSADVVYLKDASLSDITATSENNGMISVSFNTGNVINVQSTESMSARFNLTDGSAYRYNHTTKAWETLQQAPPTANQSTFTGDNQFISAGRYGNKIVLDTNFGDMNYDGASNFVVNAPTGALVVRNAVDKVIDLSNVKGTPITKAYAASTSGIIDGRGLAGREIINGSAGADVICAGDGGSQLWGGADNVADVLIGGDGADVFIGGKNQGADLILNASVEDVVNFNDATIADITSATESGGKISISFNTGNTVNVQSSLFLSAKFVLADGSSYRYSHATKSWRTD